MKNQNNTYFPWAAVGLFGLTFIISIAYGFQYRFPGGQLVGYFRLASIPFVAILGGLSWYSLRQWRKREGSISWPPILGFVLMGISFLLTVFFNSAELRPLPWPVVAVVALAVCGYCQFRWGTRGSTLAFLSCASLFYAFLATRIPHTSGANMLEIIEAASRQFLSGHTPYRFYEPIAGNAPFGYLPGLWLPYSPFVALGLDVRILNLIALLLIVLVFEKSIPVGARADTLSLTLYPFLLSPPIAVMFVHGHVWPYWVFLCLTMFYLLRSRLLPAAVFFGMSLASRQPALFLVLPLAAYLVHEVGVKKMLKYAAISVVVLLCTLLPFSVWTGKQFWQYTYFGLAGGFDTIQPHISAKNFLELVGWQQTLGYWQAAVSLIGTGFILLRGHQSRASWFLFTAGVIYAWLVFFNTYAVRYVYFPAFLLMALGFSASLVPEYLKRTLTSTDIHAPLIVD